MKLGYFFQVNARGAGNNEGIINRDNNFFKTFAFDERTLWSKYNSEGEALAFRIVNSGLLVLIVKLLKSDRPDDHVITWVHVPKEMKISGSDLNDVIKEIKNIHLSGTKDINETIFTSNPKLNRDYPETEYKVSLNASKGENLAFRKFGGDWSLEEILNNPFQEYYRNYKYVLLYEKIPDKAKELSDLSDKKLEKYVFVLPPSPQKLAVLFNTTDPLMVTINGELFNEPKRFLEGDKLDMVVWRSELFIPKKLIGKVKYNEKEAEYEENIDNNWFAKINPEDFLDKIKAYDREEPEKKLSPIISIRNNEWNESSKTLPERSLKGLKLEISVPGYVSEISTIDYLSHKSITIYLDQQPVTYNIAGTNKKVIIKGHGATSKNPLEGYVAQGKTLKYIGDGWTKRNQGKVSIKEEEMGFAWAEFFIGIACCILLVSLCWGGVKLYEMFFPKNTYETVVNKGESQKEESEELTETPEVSPPIIYSDSDAIAYLDKNNVWEHDSLEKYSLLQGLFNDLNNMNTLALSGSWKEKLYESKEFRKLAGHAKTNYDRGWNPAVGNHNPTYNKDGDYKINIKGYMEWLNNNCTKDISSGFNDNSQSQRSNTSLKTKDSSEGVKPKSNISKEEKGKQNNSEVNVNNIGN